MIKLGLIGYPLSHSLSPLMQKAALADKGIEGDYVLLETPTEKIKNIVNYLKENDFRGFNVTIPHKVAIMEYLDIIDDLAVKIGAVNTVVINENKKLTGYNTDVYGFMYAIPEDIRNNLKDKKAAIIGSGGAARAVTTGMAEMGIKEIQIITLESEIENAAEIKAILNQNYPELAIKDCILNENIDLSGVSLLVNATPVGMEGKYEGLSPLSEYSIGSLPDDSFVYDIVYKPRKTKLIEIAQKRNLRTLDGLDMLVLQGARSFSLWTGKEAPVDVMKAAIQ
jgi:shikimate dehydrogenase